jgi:hypothetical protein
LLQRLHLDELRQFQTMHAFLYLLAQWPSGGEFSFKAMTVMDLLKSVLIGGELAQFPDVLLECVRNETNADNSYAHYSELQAALVQLYHKYSLSVPVQITGATGQPILIHGPQHDVKCLF